MMELLPQMMWCAAPDGALEYANQRWRNFTGRSLRATDARAWAEVHPDDLCALESAWHEGVTAGVACEMECRVRRYDGEYRWILFEAIPQETDDGAARRWIGTCTDIESRKRAESALRAMSAQKDEFLAMLGHELRNPLAPIKTALELVKLREHDDPFSREHDIIERQVQHLTALVNDMLDISRLTRGRLSLKRGRVFVTEIVDRAVDLASPLLEERRHRLHVDIRDREAVVYGDLSRLSQVFANLLINAAKFTAPHGDITVRAQCTGAETITISVIDNGRGIEASRFETIFEPFHQGAAQASDRADGGIGLGLAIVRSIVELHDGEVTVRSTVGKGSEFNVSFPLMISVEQTSEVDLHAENAAQQRERILVVDDNHDAALTLTEYLDAVGYEVATAHDGPSALEIARQFQPSIGLLDIGLPLMDGYELAAKLVDVPGLQELRLIAVTGYGQPKDSARARQAGFHEHLVKPVDMAELLRLLPAPVGDQK